MTGRPSSRNRADLDAAAALWQSGHGFAGIGAALGWSKGQVAGIVHRARERGDERFAARNAVRIANRARKGMTWTDERLAAIATWQGHARGCHAAILALPGDPVAWDTFRHKWYDMRGRAAPEPPRVTLKPFASENTVTIARSAMTPVPRAVVLHTPPPPATEFAVRWLPPKARECQWPIGTPGRADFRFCCAKTAVTWKSWQYCEDHCREGFSNWASVRDARRVA